MKLNNYVKKLPVLFAFAFMAVCAFAQPLSPATCTASIGAPANGTGHHLAITWASSSGATSYTLEASPDNSTWNIISSGSAATTYDHNPGDVPNAPYYYRVSAVNGSGTSASKNCTQFPIYTACDNPASPVLSNPGNNSMSLDIVAESPVPNPAYTTYSIYCTTTSQYVQANGTLGATEVFQTRAQWGTINITGLAATTNYCFYAKAKNQDGDIRSPFIGILPVNTFDAANSFVKSGATGATNVWWSPGSTTSGTKFSWMSAGGCNGGSGTGSIGFTGTFTNYFGDFLRTPAVNCTGNSSVVLNFDISNTYTASHIVNSPTNSDAARFYMWIDNAYKPCSSIKINGVEVSSTDGNGKWLKFDVARTCVNVDVTYNLTGYTNLSNILFYLEAQDPYNNSGAYSVNFDNVSIKGASSVCLSTVNCTAAAIQNNPSSQGICQGNNTSFSATATGTVGSHQWQVSTNGGATWANVSNGGVYSNATTGTLNITGATIGMNNYQYRDSITGTCGGTPKSTAATLTINTVPGAAGTITGDAAVCQSQSGSYYIAGVSGATSYAWLLPTGATIATGANTAGITVNFSGSAVSGNIVVTPSNNCGAGTASPAYPVTVNSIPATPGAIAGNATPCSNTSQTYSVTAVNGATSYTWTLPGGWTGSSNSNSITVTTGTTGGAITVKANNTCGSSAAQSLSVSVNTTPATPGTISGPQPACNGTSATYSVVAVNGATTYTWTLPNGWSGSSTTNSINTTVSPNGGTVSVTAGNVCGASGAQTAIITVPAPAPAPGNINGNDTVCNGSTQVYAVTAGATSYTWTLPSGWSGSSTTNSITTTPGGAGSGTISVTANSSCGNSLPATLAVYTKPLPVTPTAITGPASLCNGTSGTYTADAVTGADYYTWTLPNGWSGSSTTATINVTGGTITGNIVVTATNSCGTSLAKTKNVTINPLPQVVASATDQTICSNDSTEICVTGTFTSYKWNNNQTSACINATAAGNYYVTATDANGCAAESNRISLSVYPVPSVSIVVKSDTLTSFGAVAYQWYYNSQPIEGATANTHVADSTGNYSVEVTDANGCKALSSPVFVDVLATGILQMAEGTVRVYPNPSLGVWQVTVTEILLGSGLEIYDATGRIVFKDITRSLQSTIELNAAPGIYMLRIISGGQVVASEKLVKLN